MFGPLELSLVEASEIVLAGVRIKRNLFHSRRVRFPPLRRWRHALSVKFIQPITGRAAIF